MFVRYLVSWSKGLGWHASMCVDRAAETLLDTYDLPVLFEAPSYNTLVAQVDRTDVRGHCTALTRYFLTGRSRRMFEVKVA